MTIVRILLVCLFFAASANAAELALLSPVLENGQPREKADPQGRPAPVFSRVRRGEIYDLVQRESTDGFTATMLALDEAAQRAAGIDKPAPTWLYLSEEEGGFARQGFWLVDGDMQRYVDDPFVDLIVDPNSVSSGDFEEIFAHEIGHVFLRRLLPSLPKGYSRTPHASLTITDYSTAFDEGFATHFQGLARRLTRNQTLHATDLGIQSKPFLGYWLSNIDRTGRIDGVRRNVFVQAQLPLPGTDSAVARRDLSSLFDTARLKNGNQMMASEGVIATLFYRWLASGDGDKAALVQTYSRLFAALHALNADGLEPDAPVFLRLVQRYAALYPQDAARVVGLVVDTTYAATTDAHIGPTTEALAEKGRLGDMKAFVDALASSRKAIGEVREAVIASPAKLDDALGPNLWLFGNDAAKSGDDAKLAVNLNTAEAEYLLTLPGIDAAAAVRAVANRRSAGPFQSLDDFVLRASISRSNAQKLHAAMDAMQKEGVYERR